MTAELRAGKALVRAQLIDPLLKAGMVRRSGQTVAECEQMFAELEAKLSYMSAESLRALREFCIRRAGGKHKNTWPAQVSIENWACDIERPKPSDSQLVRSYLRSAAGVRAVEGGYVVELFWHLKNAGSPPKPFQIERLQVEAQENQKRLAECARRRGAGSATSQDFRFLDGYEAARARVQNIISNRAGQGDEQGQESSAAASRACAG